MIKYEIMTWEDNSDNQRVRLPKFKSPKDLIPFLSKLVENGSVITSIKLWR